MNGRGLALAACASLALLAACSDNAGETVVPDQATQQAGGSIAIEARDFSFVPDRAESNSTTVTIELTNTGAEQHSLTVYTNDEFDEPVEGAVITALEPGESASITFEADAASTLNFRCEIHPGQMDGELLVGGSPTTPGSSPAPGETTTPTQEN